MATVPIVWGIGTGPTALAAYDEALAEAGCHEFNLVTVSSILPPESDPTRLEEAPSMGPTGSILHVVEAKTVASEPGSVSAGIGWIQRPDGSGVIYESAGECEPQTVERRLEAGLAIARKRRDIPGSGHESKVIHTETTGEGHTAAVVVAILGSPTPIDPIEA